MSETDGASGSDSSGASDNGSSDNDVSDEARDSVDQAMSDARDDSDNASAGTGTGASQGDGTVDDMTEDDAKETQERMEAEGRAAKDSFEARAAADQSVADAMDQEVAAQNAAAEAAAPSDAPEEEPAEEAEAEPSVTETAVPGTYADSHVSQGLSGVNEGIANVLGGPVDLVEMGLNGAMAAAEFVGVPESWTPEFEGSFLGSDHIKDMMTDMGSIGPESADPAKQTTRDVAEVTTEVVSAVVGAGLAARGAAVANQVDDIAVDTPSLLPDEGLVGTYRDLVNAGRKGDDITPHHVPSANRMAAEGVHKNDGIAMNMEQPHPGTGGRHRETFTYGTQADIDMTARDALAAGVKDARGIYQRDGLYDQNMRSNLQDLIDQNRAAHPEVFQK